MHVLSRENYPLKISFQTPHDGGRRAEREIQKTLRAGGRFVPPGRGRCRNLRRGEKLPSKFAENARPSRRQNEREREREDGRSFGAEVATHTRTHTRLVFVLTLAIFDRAYPLPVHAVIEGTSSTCSSFSPHE